MTRVPVQRQLKQEFGFRTVQAGVRTEFATQERRFADEAVMLTGDLNVAVVEWIVQYRVVDPTSICSRSATSRTRSAR